MRTCFRIRFVPVRALFGPGTVFQKNLCYIQAVVRTLTVLPGKRTDYERSELKSAMIKRTLRSFVQLCQNNKALSFITVISIVCTIAAFLLIQEVTYHTALSVTEDAITRKFSLSSKNDEILWEAYEKLTSSDEFPDISVLTLANVDYAGVYWNYETNEKTYYTPYGRFFTEQEMNDGKNVILLGSSMINRIIADQKNKNEIWENPVHIKGETLIPIGSYYTLGLPGSTKVDDRSLVMRAFAAYTTMPLNTFRRLELQPEALYCEFASPLTETQITLLQEFVDSLNGVENVSIPISGQEAIIKTYVSRWPTAILVLVGLLLTIQVLIHWLRSEFERFRIWLICGAKRKHILFRLFLEVFLIITLSFLLALGINTIVLTLMPDTVITALPPLLTAAVYVLFLVFVLIAVQIRSSAMIYRDRLLER